MQLAAATPTAPPVAGRIPIPTILGLPGPDDPGLTPSKLADFPAPGTPAADAELAVVREAQTHRTPEGTAWATQLDEHGATGMWFDLLQRPGGDAGLAQRLLTKGAVGAAIAGTFGVTQLVKQRHDRQRPFEVDPTITPAVGIPHDTSFPSGHSSSAYAAARVVSRLRPDLAEDAYDLAAQVATSRVYAGMHFPGDVVAGAQLGTAAAERVLRAMGRGPTD